MSALPKGTLGIFFSSASVGMPSTFPDFLCRLVKILSRSPLSHCSVGQGEAILEPGYRGDLFWPVTAYVLHYPRLVGAYIIPAATVDLDRLADSRQKPVWPTVLRWATFGRYPARNCVTICVDALRAGGIAVPVDVTTPQHLFDFLARQGARYVDFTTPSR